MLLTRSCIKLGTHQLPVPPFPLRYYPDRNVEVQPSISQHRPNKHHTITQTSGIEIVPIQPELQLRISHCSCCPHLQSLEQIEVTIPTKKKGMKRRTTVADHDTPRWMRVGTVSKQLSHTQLYYSPLIITNSLFRYHSRRGEQASGHDIIFSQATLSRVPVSATRSSDADASRWKFHNELESTSIDSQFTGLPTYLYALPSHCAIYHQGRHSIRITCRTEQARDSSGISSSAISLSKARRYSQPIR